MNINKLKKTLWVEKYRPSTLEGLIYQDDLKLILQDINNLNNLPHMLFYGPPGTGKTTTAINICKFLFKQNQENIIDKGINNINLIMQNIDNTKIYNQRVLELNASDERGIKIVRDKIKTFASIAINKYDNVPNFKIIILDEADAMTHDSQFALRRIIEQYSKITRFILICNYVTKIITPLVSRCNQFKFQVISKLNMKYMQDKILSNENILCEKSDDVNNYLYDVTGGDMRKYITNLQRSCYLAVLNNKSKLLIDHVLSIDSNPNICIIKEYFDYCLDNMNNIQNIYDATERLINNSYSMHYILNSLKIIILNDDNISDIIKAKIYIKMASIFNLVNNGSTDFIQLLSCISYIKYINCKMNQSTN